MRWSDGDGDDADVKTSVERADEVDTRRVDQGHMVSRVEAAFLKKQARDLLGSLVQLVAREALAASSSVVEKGEQVVVRSRLRAISVLTLSQSDVNSHLSPPPKDLGNELVLLAASDVPGLVLQPTDVSASSRGKPIALDEVAHNHRGGTNVAVHLSWLGQVGDTRVRAHQHVHRVETSLEEPGGEENVRLKID